MLCKIPHQVTDGEFYLERKITHGNTAGKENAFLIQNTFPVGAIIDCLVRRESYELPLEAIREMIISARCHRNLLDEFCIQVAICDDRLEARTFLLITRLARTQTFTSCIIAISTKRLRSRKSVMVRVKYLSIERKLQSRKILKKRIDNSTITISIGRRS